MLQNNDYSVNGLYETSCGIVGLEMLDLPGNGRWSNPGAERTFCILALDSYKNAKRLIRQGVYSDGFLRSHVHHRRSISAFRSCYSLYSVDEMMENEIKESSLH